MKHKKKQASPRWKLPVASLVAGLVILLGTGIFMYPHVASWFSQLAQSRVVGQELISVQGNEDRQEYVNEQLELAREYNDALSSGAIYEAHSNIASSRGELVPGAGNYHDLLNETGSGFMGRILYEDLGIDLPIYHGTSEEVLETGVGHLEGTSLPVGGVGTRSVLTAHRGLPEATLFNELNRAQIGDVFTVTVMGEVFAYEVIDTQVIEPDANHEILPDADRDLLSLLTCTPLGINTHRILVTAERIFPTPAAAESAGLAEPQLPHFPWWIIVISATVIIVAVYVWRDGYRVARLAQATVDAQAREAENVRSETTLHE